MARRILILILVSPGVALYLQGKEPGIQAGPSRAPLAVTAACEGSDGFLCGECPCTEPERGGDRNHGAYSPVFSTQETAAGRGVLNGSPRHGLGPVLSSLSDSEVLSRPPPAVPGRS